MSFILDSDLLIDTSHYEISLKRNDIMYILDFILLWNLFECKVCSKNFKKEEINNYVSSINIALNSLYIDEAFFYFKDRYLNNENKFENLNLRGDAQKIKNNLQWNNDKMYTIIFIIQRYRNNMFHGEKNISFLEWQKNNFEVANAFLSKLLENYY